METPAHRVAQAEALLNSDMLRDAFAALEADALEEILNPSMASGTEADRVRREAAERIKIVRAIPQMLRTALAVAKSDMADAAAVA